MATPRIFYGSVINPETLTSLSAMPRALLAVNSQGYVDWLEEDVDSSLVQDLLASKGLIDVDIVELKPGEFLLPGFIDTHTHAPQLPNIGSGQQYELLDWLENITFPMESRFANVDFAKKIYPEVVSRFINSGTTTCCYYGSLHLEATKILADTVLEQGQRAFVGKCNMNRNCPDHYCEPSSEVSITDTREVIAYIRSLNTTLVHPVLTPRFAISCTGDLLRALGDMAEEDPSLAIQTHISENLQEVKFTRELFPQCNSYAEVYDHHGLLSKRTILAHAVHLDDRELVLIKERCAGVSHCPTSNFNLRSGMARVGEMLDHGIKVGLGTDVSGGFSPSLLTVIQHASICSKMVALHTSHQRGIEVPKPRFANKQLPIPALLYLATVGGAELCNLKNETGRLKEGFAFDAILVNIRPETGNSAIWSMPDEFAAPPSKEILEGFLEKFLFGGADSNISGVFVQGRLIGGSTFVEKLRN